VKPPEPKEANQDPEGNKFSSLLVGYYDAERLTFAGKVRQGFNPASRLALMTILKPLAIVCVTIRTPRKL
jgi:ATP-dependent DNA ligase